MLIIPCHSSIHVLTLRLTAIMGNQALGNLLLDFDADIDAQNEQGATALILAIKARRQDGEKDSKRKSQHLFA